MADIQEKSELKLTVTLKLSEDEARALHALTMYGADSFIDIFYKHLGENYLKRHEGGLRVLFNSVSANFPRVFKNIDDARKLMETKDTRPVPIEHPVRK